MNGKVELCFSKLHVPNTYEAKISCRIFRFNGLSVALDDPRTKKGFAAKAEYRFGRGWQDASFVCKLTRLPGMREIVVWPNRLVLVTNVPWARPLMVDAVAGAIRGIYDCDVEVDASALKLHIL